MSKLSINRQHDHERKSTLSTTASIQDRRKLSYEGENRKIAKLFKQERAQKTTSSADDLSASPLLTVLESSCSSQDTRASGNVLFLHESSFGKELSDKREEFKRGQRGMNPALLPYTSDLTKITSLTLGKITKQTNKNVLNTLNISSVIKYWITAFSYIILTKSNFRK